MQNFELIARAVIIQDNKILLCKRKDLDYYFLPGGHVEFGEKAETAIAREIKEELGIEVSELSFIGSSENFFTQDDARHHEFNLVFSAQIGGASVRSIEDHLEFTFFNGNEFADTNILPVSLKSAIFKWQKNSQIFWASEG